MRLVDADKLKISYDGHFVGVAKNDLDNAPTVVADIAIVQKADEQKHGHWIRFSVERSPEFVNGHFYEGRWQSIARCSVCSQAVAVGNEMVDFKFCPNCGAEMDENIDD